MLGALAVATVLASGERHTLKSVSPPHVFAQSLHTLTSAQETSANDNTSEGPSDPPTPIADLADCPRRSTLPRPRRVAASPKQNRQSTPCVFALAPGTTRLHRAGPSTYTSRKAPHEHGTSIIHLGRRPRTTDEMERLCLSPARNLYEGGSHNAPGNGHDTHTHTPLEGQHKPRT